jgi:hypothetical protein
MSLRLTLTRSGKSFAWHRASLRNTLSWRKLIRRVSYWSGLSISSFTHRRLAALPVPRSKQTSDGHVDCIHDLEVSFRDTAMVMVIGHSYQVPGPVHAERSKLMPYIACFCGFWAIVGFLTASIL